MRNQSCPWPAAMVLALGLAVAGCAGGAQASDGGKSSVDRKKNAKQKAQAPKKQVTAAKKKSSTAAKPKVAKADKPAKVAKVAPKADETSGDGFIEKDGVRGRMIAGSFVPYRDAA